VVCGTVMVNERHFVIRIVRKRRNKFERVAAYRDRFRATPTETLVHRYQTGPLIKEAQIAIREVLEERNEVHLIRPAANDRET
jgi:hypothetical protein